MSWLTLIPIKYRILKPGSTFPIGDVVTTYHEPMLTLKLSVGVNNFFNLRFTKYQVVVRSLNQILANLITFYEKLLHGNRSYLFALLFMMSFCFYCLFNALCAIRRIYNTDKVTVNVYCKVRENSFSICPRVVVSSLEQFDNKRCIEMQQTCYGSRRISADSKRQMRLRRRRCCSMLAVWCRVAGRAKVDILRCTDLLSAEPSTTRSPCAGRRHMETARHKDWHVLLCSMCSWPEVRHSAVNAAWRWWEEIVCQRLPAPTTQHINRCSSLLSNYLHVLCCV